jgi:hypothetical protein
VHLDPPVMAKTYILRIAFPQGLPYVKDAPTVHVF